MSLADIVKAGIAVANTVTENGELQDEVSIAAWTGYASNGTPTFASTVSIPALIELKVQRIKLPNGDLVNSIAKVTFLRPITANGATGRREPIDPRDDITLPDGTVGRALQTEGLVNEQTGAPFMLQVWLG